MNKNDLLQDMLNSVSYSALYGLDLFPEETKSVKRKVKKMSVKEFLNQVISEGNYSTMETLYDLYVLEIISNIVESELSDQDAKHYLLSMIRTIEKRMSGDGEE